MGILGNAYSYCNFSNFIYCWSFKRYLREVWRKGVVLAKETVKGVKRDKADVAVFRILHEQYLKE